MLVKHEILYFVVSIIQTHSVPAFGVYAYRTNSNQLSESKCMASSEVYSLFPVPAYLAGGVNYITLKNLAVSE